MYLKAVDCNVNFFPQECQRNSIVDFYHSCYLRACSQLFLLYHCLRTLLVDQDPVVLGRYQHTRKSLLKELEKTPFIILIVRRERSDQLNLDSGISLLYLLFYFQSFGRLSFITSEGHVRWPAASLNCIPSLPCAPRDVL